MEKRERTCLETLKKLPRDHYVLIGGYAVSSYDFPRFSIDLDISIPEKKKNRFEEKLKKEGFNPTKKNLNLPGDKYGGKFKRFEKSTNGASASIDLLVNSVVSRQTGSSYSFKYLYRNSEIREVTGFSVELESEARVADREMLFALKTNSMRTTDKRDLIALCNADLDIDKVLKHLERCPEKKISQNIDELTNYLENKEQRNSIKGTFGLKDRTYEKLFERALETIKELQKNL